MDCLDWCIIRRASLSMRYAKGTRVYSTVSEMSMFDNTPVQAIHKRGREFIAQCPKCLTFETLLFFGDSLVPTKRFIQKADRRGKCKIYVK